LVALKASGKVLIVVIANRSKGRFPSHQDGGSSVSEGAIARYFPAECEVERSGSIFLEA
jgi:hypothetical protein